VRVGVFLLSGNVRESFAMLSGLLARGAKSWAVLCNVFHVFMNGQALLHFCGV
jgi:hypothetical protein